VVGTISLSCELCSLSKAAFVHVRPAQLCTENSISIYMCSAVEVAWLAIEFSTKQYMCVISSTVAFRCLSWLITLVHLFNDIHKPMLGLIGLIIAT